MTLEDALELLLGGEAGVQEWNRIRETGATIPSFSKVDLYEAELHGVQLHDAILEEARVYGAYLKDAKLYDTDLRWAKLHRAYLKYADLQRADLSDADLSSTTLSGANLSHATLRNANLNNAKLHCANLTHADLADADLHNADLSGANLTGANLRKAKLGSTNLNNAVLQNAQLQGTNFHHADIDEADLTGANLEGCDLYNSMLRGANLTGSSLRYARLNNADLRGAVLDGTDFRNGDLSFANFTGTNFEDALMEGANLTGALFDSTGQVKHHCAEKILFIAADPSDEIRLKIQMEIRELENELRSSPGSDGFVFEIQLAVRPKDLSRALLKLPRAKFLHFSGHGTKGTGELCLENDAGESMPVAGEAIAKLLRPIEFKLRCIVLNACYTEAQAAAILDHVEYVVGMSDSIRDDAAMAFSIGFYQGIFNGLSIPDSFDLGRAQIQMTSDGQQHIPKLLTKLH